ncbi:MAG: DUF4837 family protein [Bacteroidales bacterium]|nr:DUF4837 family protein [Bacteroidales bacterium]MCF8405378.1 DUF4837 family protein [Bacteroidales bacterium]
MKNTLFILAFSFSLFSLNSCNDSTVAKSNGSSSVLLPKISGAAGEILVVMDNFNWKNKSGDLIRETLEQEYPALTQPEPIFDISQIPAGAFDGPFKFHRTIIRVDVGSEIKESTIKYGEDMWATPQLVITIDAPDSYALESLILREKENILQNILKYDRKRLQDLYNQSKDAKIKEVLNNFNVSMAIPRGYNIDFSNHEFASVSIETPKTSQVIFIYQYPHKGESDFKTSMIVEKRNEFLKKYTVGTRTDSYLTTAEIFQPQTYDIQFEGKEIVELRGWWEMYNGFMGGPFISHTMLDKKRNMIVVADAYVYYPNNKKRNMMRQLEAIVYSMRFLSK